MASSTETFLLIYDGPPLKFERGTRQMSDEEMKAWRIDEKRIFGEMRAALEPLESSEPRLKLQNPPEENP